jgi:hypothetical protein
MAECVEIGFMFFRHAVDSVGMCLCDLFVLPSLHSRRIDVEDPLLRAVESGTCNQLRVIKK